MNQMYNGSSKKQENVSHWIANWKTLDVTAMEIKVGTVLGSVATWNMKGVHDSHEANKEE